MFGDFLEKRQELYKKHGKDKFLEPPFRLSPYNFDQYLILMKNQNKSSEENTSD